MSFHADLGEGRVSTLGMVIVVLGRYLLSGYLDPSGHSGYQIRTAEGH